MEQQDQPKLARVPQNQASCIAGRGWKSRNSSSLPVEGKIFSLTFPFIELTILLCPVACVKGGVTQVNFTAIPVAHLPVSNQRCFRIATIWESICLNPLRRSGVPLHSERY